MRMSLNLSLSVHLLRCSKVVRIGIDEEAGLHALNSHLNGEVRVSLDGAAVGWEDELGGRHVSRGGNDTHGCRIT